MAGQSLIRASELRAVTSEYQRYAAAANTFRDKYFALPGDMTNATAFWGASTGNGDGNGQISTNGTASINETGLFWVDLSLAGLIEGSYVMSSPSAISIPGSTLPRSKLTNAQWSVLGIGTVAPAGTLSWTGFQNVPATDEFYAGDYGNVFLFGTLAFPNPPAGVLKSEEAWNIDTKLDDGKPDTGLVTTLENEGSATAGSGCGNQATSTSAMAPSAYDLTNQSKTACALVIKTGF